MDLNLSIGSKIPLTGVFTNYITISTGYRFYWTLTWSENKALNLEISEHREYHKMEKTAFHVIPLLQK
jgi:hypothetical protein